MRDIIKNEKRSDTEEQEMGVLDQYAEMCRYQSRQQSKDEDPDSPEEMENDNSEKEQKLKQEDTQNEQIKEMGQVVLGSNSRKHKVELLTIIGEVEGHESAPSHSKTTKYEHVLPKLAIIEDDEEIEGLLILLNTVGGDVEAGLAINADKSGSFLQKTGTHTPGIRQTFHYASGTDQPAFPPCGNPAGHDRPSDCRAF